MIVKESIFGIQRHYSQISLSFNESRIPNSLCDTLVVITIDLTAADAEIATTTFQIDSGSGFSIISTVSNEFNVSGIIGITGNSTIKQVMTFIVPCNSSYKIVNSGTGTSTITSIYELIL